MPDEQEVERLEAAIRTRYPYPLAATFYRAYYEAPEPLLAHDYLMNLFEVTLKYLTTIVLAQYFRDGVNDARINENLQSLRRPSLGHWQSWLRDILDLYSREGRIMAVAELTEFYNRRQSGAIAEAYNAIDGIVKARPVTNGGRNTVQTRQFFELLGTYRNWLAHGASPRPQDRERAAEVMAPALRALYMDMAFVADYRLVYVKEVTVDYDASQPGAMRFGHRLTYLTGDRPRLLNEPQVLGGEALHPKELYLLDNSPQFRPLLSLHPFWVFRRCDTCTTEEAYVLNESNDRSLEYISYQTGDRFNPTEYVDYMQSLLRGLKGAQPQAAGIALPIAPGSASAEVLPLPAPVNAGAGNDADTVDLSSVALPVADAPPTTPRIIYNDEARTGSVAPVVPTTVPPRIPPPPAAPPVNRPNRMPLVLGVVAGLIAVLLLVSVGVIVALNNNGTSAAISATETPDEQASSVDNGEPPTDTPEADAGVETPGVEATQVTAEPAATEVAQGVDEPTATAAGQDEEPTATADATNNSGGLLGQYRNLQPTMTLEAGVEAIIAYSPDSSVLAAGYYPSTIDLWSPEGKKLHTLSGHTDQITALAFAPDGKILASGGRDHTVRLWDVATGKLLRTIALDGTPYQVSVVFGPDGKQIGVAADQIIAVYNVADGSQVSSEDVGYSIGSLTLSSDGSMGAWGGYDFNVHVFNARDGGELNVMKGHTDLVTGVDFAPDGNVLASCGDNIIRLWNPYDGSLDGELKGDTERVWAVDFSADSKLLASVSADGTTRIWPSDGSIPLVTLPRGGSSVSLSPDGKWLASASDGYGISIWRMADIMP